MRSLTQPQPNLPFVLPPRGSQDTDSRLVAWMAPVGCGAQRPLLVPRRPPGVARACARGWHVCWPSGRRVVWFVFDVVRTTQPPRRSFSDLAISDLASVDVVRKRRRGILAPLSRL